MADFIEDYVNSRHKLQYTDGAYANSLSEGLSVDIDAPYIIDTDKPMKPIMASSEAAEKDGSLSEDELLDVSTPAGKQWAKSSRAIYNRWHGGSEGMMPLDTPSMTQTDVSQPVDPATSPDVSDERLRADTTFRDVTLPREAYGNGIKRPETDQDFARWGVEFMGQFNYNMTKMAVDYAKLRGMDEQTALNFYNLMYTYDKLPMFTWNGTKRMFKGLATDPTTYAGLGTLGLSFIGRAGSKQMTKKGFQEALKRKIQNPYVIAAIEGGAYSGLDDALRQGVEIEAKVREGIDPLQTAGAAAVGAAAGTGLVGAVDAAPTVARAVGDRLSQPGEMPTVGALGGNIGEPILRALSIFNRPKKQASRIREIALQRKPLAEGEEPKILTEDLHKYFDEIALQKNGKKLNITDNASDFEAAKKEIVSELLIQTKREISGKGWYDDDIFRSLVLLARIPGFEDLQTNETRRVIFSAILGATSPGPKVEQNIRTGAGQYLLWSQTGKLSTEAPPPNTPVAGIEKAGFGPYGFPKGLTMIQFLLDKFGEEGFADFMLSPQTKQELTDLRKEAGFKSGPTGMSGKADSMHFGAAILGDKAGKFMLNINGYPTTTKDKWFVRSIRRLEGTFGDNLVKNKKGEMVELGQPKNKTERLAMDRLVSDVINAPELADLKLSEQDAQALLWFREQNLYSDLGVRTSPQTFSQGVEAISGQEGFGIRGSDEVEAALEQGTAQLPDFRNVSTGQRAVRADRRRQLEELNNPGSDAGSSGPYSTGSAGDAGRDRRLEADEQTRSRYELAGLRIPTIEVQDSAASQQYATDISSAMAEHKFGAQVELKSADDLASYKMFRTEDGGGFSIKPDGDIVAVFQPPGAAKGGIYAVLQAAIAQGGKKLDAFNTMLPRVYETVGFRPVARVKWNDEYAPQPPYAAKAWDKEIFKKYNNGEPDVVLFVYDKNYFGGENIKDLPIFDDFDQAAALQEQALKDLEGQ